MRTVLSRPCAWLAVAAAVVAGAAAVSASVANMFMAVPANAAAPTGQSVPISLASHARRISSPHPPEPGHSKVWRVSDGRR